MENNIENTSLVNATNEDTDFARKAHHLAYKEVITRQFGGWDEGAQDDFFYKSWNPDTHQIVRFNNVPAGYCSIIRNPDHIFLSALVIMPEFQGKGIGTKLLLNLINESDNLGLPIKLQVFKENKAQELYRSVGFRDVEDDGIHLKMEYIKE